MHLLVTALLLIAATAGPHDEYMPFAVAQTSPDSVRIVTKQPLASGQTITIVLFDPERVITGRVMAPAPEPGDPDVQGSVYTITLSGNPKIDFGTGIAVIRESVTTTLQKGHVEMRNVLSPGDRVRFRRCASTEGLHLTVWEGKTRVWHEYFYLGYDVDPTCTDEETRDQ